MRDKKTHPARKQRGADPESNNFYYESRKPTQTETTSMSNYLTKAAEYWSNKAPDVNRTRWWHHQTIVQHINSLVTGNPAQGFHHLLKMHAKNQNGEVFGRAISIGCGSAAKEINLLKLGIVRQFDLVEIAETRIASGIETARLRGVDSHVNFIHGDIFSKRWDQTYDLVYWNNSLHHMLSADQAVRWSRDHLKDTGLFAMDDFVGPTRFQWSEYNLEMASRTREILPERRAKT